ncbi:hypothetical protein PR202_ga18085 [Eleusine coracana subsp. coracana]|uniref:Secreted protein n=1 Tax=Eleusine coracana subsp. coracana TaxID=191504 RepID=A0AAV5CR41_ELECO|nr:hypothetical protein PR202_ga18085 [Eleusine coracana subsp. coracana]
MTVRLLVSLGRPSAIALVAPVATTLLAAFVGTPGHLRRSRNPKGARGTARLHGHGFMAPPVISPMPSSSRLVLRSDGPLLPSLVIHAGMTGY